MKKPTPLQSKYLALLASGDTVCIAGINWKHYRTLRALVRDYGLKYRLCGNTWLRLGANVDDATLPSLCYVAPTSPFTTTPSLPTFSAWAPSAS